jgi:hypothetical protein
MNNFGADVKYLLSISDQLPPDLLTLVDGIATVIVDAVKQVKTLREGTQSGATPNISLLNTLSGEAINLAIQLAIERGLIDPAKADELKARTPELVAAVQGSEAYKKSAAKTIAGMKLNVRGEFAKLTKSIEDTAMEFVERFKVKPIWARNLVGMFTADIDLETRDKFLALCRTGKALNIEGMIKQGHGTLDNVIATKDPTIKKVYNSVKATLLDISLSTGQRGATGPFEAMLAIMGGAVKPEADEGGDIKIKINGKDKKFEVKAGSITVNVKPGVKQLNISAGESSAWLDSTGELSGDNLRSKGNAWLDKNLPNLTPAQKTLWQTADFRSKKLPNLKDFLISIDKKDPGNSSRLIANMMLQSFPSVRDEKVKAAGFNFATSVKKILAGIMALDKNAIAREQGAMALIEYAVGKGNDGFILFNSSIQEYKIFMELKGIVDVYNQRINDDDARTWEESLVRFIDPMTMQPGAMKSSPSIYFGPLGKSQRAKRYAQEYAMDPERVAEREKAEANGDKELPDAESGFGDGKVPKKAAATRSQAADKKIDKIAKGAPAVTGLRPKGAKALASRRGRISEGIALGRERR